MQRDRFVNETSSEMGYTVMRFWEHEVRNNLKACANQVMLYREAVKTNEIPLNE